MKLKHFIMLFLSVPVIFVLYIKLTYRSELNKIKAELNKIEGVTVLDIWGHDDISLEEIAARIHIEHKGTMVLGSLSKDVFSYPNKVSIQEINGYSFTCISCTYLPGWGSMDYYLGISPALDIGSESLLAKNIGIDFYSPKDVVRNYDAIKNLVDSLPLFPELKYLKSNNQETYLGKNDYLSKDIDPLFELESLSSKFLFAKQLKWKSKECYK